MHSIRVYGLGVEIADTVDHRKQSGILRARCAISNCFCRQLDFFKLRVKLVDHLDDVWIVTSLL